MDESIRDPAELFEPGCKEPPHMADAYRYWLDSREGGTVPHRRHLDPTRMPVSILRWVAVLEPLDEGEDFLIRLVGSGVAGALQTNVTNLRASALQKVDIPAERLRWSVRNQRPYLTTYALTWVYGRDFIDYNAIVLPFAEEDDVVSRLLLVFSFDFSSSKQQ